jgi:hypothetical protein
VYFVKALCKLVLARAAADTAEMDGQNDPPDRTADVEEGRWMAFAELANVRAISKLSAAKLVRRHGWRRQQDNQRYVRALVPLEWAMPGSDREADDTPDSPADGRRDILRMISALEGAVTALRERTEAAEAGRCTADARAEAATMRTDRAEQTLAEQRERADALQERIAGLLSQIAASEAEAKTAHDRAWASGEAAGALQKQLAATEGRFDAERKRAERAEKRADGDRQALLDAESKTWRTLAALEAAHKQSKQLQAKLAEAEVAAETAIRSANAVRQEDEARRGRGLLPRLLATWRGK